MLIVLSASAVDTVAGRHNDQPYRLQGTKLNSKDISYVFDGKQIRLVKILDIRDANTEANKASCAKEWKNVDAYRQLCLSLADHRILDVEVLQYPIAISRQVPVIRIAKVTIGHHAFVKMPEILPSEVVKSVALFMGMHSNSDLRRAL